MTKDELEHRLAETWDEAYVLTRAEWQVWRWGSVDPNEEPEHHEGVVRVVVVRGPAYTMLPVPEAMIRELEPDALLTFLGRRLEFGWGHATTQAEGRSEWQWEAI